MVWFFSTMLAWFQPFQNHHSVQLISHLISTPRVWGVLDLFIPFPLYNVVQNLTKKKSKFLISHMISLFSGSIGSVACVCTWMFLSVGEYKLQCHVLNLLNSFIQNRGKDMYRKVHFKTLLWSLILHGCSWKCYKNIINYV